MIKINVEKALAGGLEVEIQGAASSRIRQEKLEQAIALSQKAPDWDGRSAYFGVKRYSGFGDQGSDHDHGMGPRHGNIVFRVDRRRNRETYKPVEVSEDGIYLMLLAVENPEIAVGELVEKYRKAVEVEADLQDQLADLAEFKNE